MTTTIAKINNQQIAPVCYAGVDRKTPTGWAAWAFPTGVYGFGWGITDQMGQQCLMTEAGTFYIWDAGGWNIDIQKVGGTPTRLIHVNGMNPQIQIDVASDGTVTAQQL